MSRLALIFLVVGLVLSFGPPAAAGSAASGETIDLDGVPRLRPERPSKPFRPKAFATSDGGAGWIVRIVNSGANETYPHVPTPAVDDGRVFVGGGLSSTALHAFDARRGEHLWTSRLNDNGPSAVAVSRGRVVVNTDSCTTYGIDAITGSIAWSHLLGPSIHSSPTVVGRQVLAAGHRSSGGFGLLALDLRRGGVSWSKTLSSDLIGAPVHAEGRLYLAGQDGALTCLDLDGGQRWSVRIGATSAPWVGLGGLYVASQSRSRAAGRTAVLCVDPRDGAIRWRNDGTRGRPAGDPVTVAYRTSPEPAVSAVGWCADPPRPVIVRDRCVLGDGADLVISDPGTGEETRRRRLPPGRWFHAPPVVLGDHLLFATRDGLLLEIEPASGEPRRALDLGMRFTSQPVVARGRLYVASGPFLVCVPWGDADGPEWPQWGGGADRSGR